MTSTSFSTRCTDLHNDWSRLGIRRRCQTAAKSRSRRSTMITDAEFATGASCTAVASADLRLHISDKKCRKVAASPSCSDVLEAASAMLQLQNFANASPLRASEPKSGHWRGSRTVLPPSGEQKTTCPKRAAGRRWPPNWASHGRRSTANWPGAERQARHDRSLVSHRRPCRDRRVFRFLSLGPARPLTTLVYPKFGESCPFRMGADPCR